MMYFFLSPIAKWLDFIPSTPPLCYHVMLLLTTTSITHHHQWPLGEIEIELQWTDRLYEYDLELAQQKQVMARRIQCMARKQHAKNAVKRLRKEREELLKLAHRSAELVTATIRMKIALKVRKTMMIITTTFSSSTIAPSLTALLYIYQHNATYLPPSPPHTHLSPPPPHSFSLSLHQVVAYRKLFVLSAFKIQMRVRMFQAQAKLAQRKIEFLYATVITKYARVYLARRMLAWLKWERAELLRISTTVIQRETRRWLAELKAIDMEKDRVYEQAYQTELLEGSMTYEQVHEKRLEAEEAARIAAEELALAEQEKLLAAQQAQASEEQEDGTDEEDEDEEPREDEDSEDKRWRAEKAAERAKKLAEKKAREREELKSMGSLRSEETVVKVWRERQAARLKKKNAADYDSDDDEDDSEDGEWVINTNPNRVFRRIHSPNPVLSSSSLSRHKKTNTI